jgi:hypothetical protein
VSSAIGELPDPKPRIVNGSVDDMGSTKLQCEFSRSRIDIDGDHRSPQGGADQDGGKAYPSTTVYGKPFPGLESRPVDQSAKCCAEATTESGCVHRLEAIGETDEVHIGVVDRNELGKRPPRCEAGGEGSIAGVEMPLETRATVATADRERHSYTISHLPVLDCGTYIFYAPGHFVPEDVRKPGKSFVPHPGVPVAEANPCGLDPEDDPTLRCHRVVDLVDRQWMLKFGEQGCAQDRQPTALVLSTDMVVA